MKKIAITGVMGAGKSSCSKLINQLGYEVVDCDQLSHHLMQKGQEGYRQVVQAFSSQILDENEEIHRPTLANCIFNDLTKKKQLELILHPLILQEIKQQAKKCKKSLFFVEVALLFETGMEVQFDEVICVCAPLPLILERLQKGRNMSYQQAKQRWNGQMSQDEKMKRSSFVIWNNHQVEDVKPQLLAWINKMQEEENGTEG